jgi:hypothetical protein
VLHGVAINRSVCGATPARQVRETSPDNTEQVPAMMPVALLANGTHCRVAAGA